MNQLYNPPCNLKKIYGGTLKAEWTQGKNSVPQSIEHLQLTRRRREALKTYVCTFCTLWRNEKFCQVYEIYHFRNNEKKSRYKYICLQFNGFSVSDFHFSFDFKKFLCLTLPPLPTCYYKTWVLNSSKQNIFLMMISSNSYTARDWRLAAVFSKANLKFF